LDSKKTSKAEALDSKKTPKAEALDSKKTPKAEALDSNKRLALALWTPINVLRLRFGLQNFNKNG
jgi:hypothetical protein